MAHDFTGHPEQNASVNQTLKTKDCTGRADEIIVGGSFPLQLRVHCYNFSCGVESCMLKSFEGGTACLPAVVVRMGGE